MRIPRELPWSWLASRLLPPGSGSRSCGAPPGVSRGRSSAAPNLRPHATMLDLLFCMVMVFAFQMGQPVESEAEGETIPEAVAIEDRSAGAAPEEERVLLRLRPRFERGRWVYREAGGGRALAPEDVLARARNGAAVPVFVLDGETPLRGYLEAEAPLRDRGLTVEVMVVSKETRP